MNAHPGLFASVSAVSLPSELRPYQADALAMVRAEVAAGHRRIVLQMPTGAGKTRVAAAICDGALRKGNRAVFTVPMLSLVNQTVDRFWAEGVRDVGVMQARHEMTDASRLVQVATVQTLRRRKLAPPSVMLVDEAHVRDRKLEALLDRPEWADVIVVGLSATPWSRGMGQRWECLLAPVTMADLIRDRWLVPYRVFAPAQPDLSAVSVRAGDYAEDQLATVMGDGKLVADIVETWRGIGEDRPTLCFAVDRAHAQKIGREFSAAGIAAEYADAFTPPDERDAIGERLRSGQTKVVCNVGIFTTGTDWPWVSCLILARPTKSHALFVQQVGRGLRTSDGKADCLVLDHAGNALKLGFPDAIHFDELDSGEAGKAAEPRPQARDKRPKKCPSCHCLRPAGVFKCPSCGETPERTSDILCEEGELVEMDSRRKAAASHGDKQRFYSELQGLAREKGKNEKWVLAQFKTRFGVWPRGMVPQATDPSPETRSWIQSRNIAWAKRKRRAA